MQNSKYGSKTVSRKKVERKGGLFANGQIFSVFDVQNSTDVAVLVRINVAQAQKLISQAQALLK